MSLWEASTVVATSSERSATVVAEIGVNHNGSLGLAKDLIVLAHEAGADYAKFQTFRADALASKSAPLAAYQKASARGASQREMLSQLELTERDFLDLQVFSNEVGIGFLTTAHDMESAIFVLKMELDFVKIPSGDITHLPFLELVARQSSPILLSTGMAELAEVRSAINVLTNSGFPISKITVLQCTTEYPAPIENANLRAMVAMGEELGVGFGYSDHTLGTISALAAVAMGAQVVEKHITSDRALPGPDHRASLEPAEFAEMVSGIRTIELALGSEKKGVQLSEFKNRELVRKSIVAKRNIKAGDIFTGDVLGVMRPGIGISPMEWHAVIGTRAVRDYRQDEPIEVL
jgi:N,N'-diacetyllegionaminate synthase